VASVNFDENDYRWDGDRFAVAFGADVNGKRIVCLISGEALMDRFLEKPSAKREDLLQAFLKNRQLIQQKARELIERNAFEDGRILIRGRDLVFEPAGR